MNFSKIRQEYLRVVRANSTIACYPNVKARSNKVNLWELDVAGFWGCAKFGKYNLGDYLARVVVEYMLDKNSLSLESPSHGTKFLNSIGSNLLLSYQDATIWGSGVERELPWYRTLFHNRPFRKLDIRAVRGPLTRDCLIKLGHKNTPATYGDPAILLPLIHNPPTEKKYDYIIIPQYVTESKLRNQITNGKIVSMRTDDYKSVISQIKASKKVISSSLHGIIIAEAYGIPAVWFRGLMKEVDFKYQDYYYSTNRKGIVAASSLEEALVQTPPPLPDLTDLQEGLLKSFPYDLWKQ